MHDARHDKLANLLVTYSCEVQPGEKVLIECYDTPIEFIDAIVKAVYKAGGYPLLELKYNKLLRTMLMGASKESLAAIQDTELHRMKNMDAFIGVRGVSNAK